MKALQSIFIVCVLCFSTQANGQIFDKIGKKAKEAAEDTIERKVEEKSAEKTGEIMDTLLNQDKKLSKKERKKLRKQREQEERQRQQQSGQSEGNLEVDSGPEKHSYSSDFTAGSNVVFTEDFLQVDLNDFPGTWNTNGSGSIVTFGNDETKWLRMDPNVSFTPDGINSIPINSTLEFDLKVDDNYYKISKGIDIVFAQFKNKAAEFGKFYTHSRNKNAVIITLDPITHTSYGSRAKTFASGQKIIDKTLGHNGFNKDNRTVHISIWRQETRLRFYIDGQKIWDLPRAFSKDVNYNTLLFGVSRGKPDDAFYVSNIRLAKAGEDTRVKLLESGSFSTSDIQFDSGQSTLKATSISIIEQLVQELNETPNAQVKIIGHTDSDGSAEANLELSRQRAYAVKDKMIKLGVINYDRISVEGKGESEPMINNSTEENKAKNRRVEFKIIN